MVRYTLKILQKKKKKNVLTNYLVLNSLIFVLLDTHDNFLFLLLLFFTRNNYYIELSLLIFQNHEHFH